MVDNIMKVVEILDSSDKVEGKLHVVDVCYDIMDAIYIGSRKEDVENNVLVVEKSIEDIIKRLDESDIESMSAQSLISTLYRYLSKVSFVLLPSSFVSLSMIKAGYAIKMAGVSHASIIDKYDDLDLLEKTGIAVVCKEYEKFLARETFSLLGTKNGEEIMFDFISQSFYILKDSLDAAMDDDEMTIDMFTAQLRSKFTKASKNIFMEKYKSGDLDLSKCSLSSIYAGKTKKDIVPVFVSDIYKRTGFINEDGSDDEFDKDCCDLLGISLEEYNKTCLLPGKVSYLKLVKLMKQIDSKREEE